MSFTLPDYPPDDIIGNGRRAVKHIYYANVIERGQTRRPDYTLIYSHNQYTLHSLLEYVFVDLLIRHMGLGSRLFFIRWRAHCASLKTQFQILWEYTSAVKIILS